MKIAIVGGCGHVGLPLGVSLAAAGAEVVAFDIDAGAVSQVNSGAAPFHEDSLNKVLTSTLGKTFRATTDERSVIDANVVVMIVGTPLDVHLNPDPNAVVDAVAGILDLLNKDQILILRSTVYPGVTRRIEKLLKEANKKLDIAFCPERIVEGSAMKELKELPQIIGARSDKEFERSKSVFDYLGVESIRCAPEEAELAKLFTNTWRYIKFAAANQFWMMANEAGIEYEHVRNVIRYEYPRASDLPGAGFSAGPCLFKDTMQLASFSGSDFPLGNAAMLVNEYQPDYVVRKLREQYDLSNLTVGILGMAFKGQSDDIRSSLAYKLKRILKFHARRVLTSDPFVMRDVSLISEERLLEESDLIIIGAPHERYRNLKSDTRIIDIWNILGLGTRV
jgi:UDP-N-acetyl-D-mannosaminuronic acid dehydrogenase